MGRFSSLRMKDRDTKFRQSCRQTYLRQSCNIRNDMSVLGCFNFLKQRFFFFVYKCLAVASFPPCPMLKGLKIVSSRLQPRLKLVHDYRMVINTSTFYDHTPAGLINTSSLSKRLQLGKCHEMLLVFCGLGFCIF